jgi:hypothetical protein
MLLLTFPGMRSGPLVVNLVSNAVDGTFSVLRSVGSTLESGHVVGSVPSRDWLFMLPARRLHQGPRHATETDHGVGMGTRFDSAKMHLHGHQSSPHGHWCLGSIGGESRSMYTHAHIRTRIIYAHACTHARMHARTHALDTHNHDCVVV